MAQFDSNGGRDHRTALFIDATNGFAGEFAERVNRLLESLNGVNIKVDVYAATKGGNVSVDRVANGDTISAYASPAYDNDGFTVEGAREWAREEGYTQVLFSFPA